MSKVGDKEEMAKPAAATIDPAIQTTRHPNLFVNALTIGPVG